MPTPVASPYDAAIDAATATAPIVGRETMNVAPFFVIRYTSVPEASCQTLPGSTFVSAGGWYCQFVASSVYCCAPRSISDAASSPRYRYERPVDVTRTTSPLF